MDWRERVIKVSHNLRVTILIASVFLFLGPPLAFADILWQDCVTSWKYTENSTYQSNLNQLSATLTEKASTSATLFAVDSAGAVPDTVYALALCRGDTNASACGDCVANAFQDAQQVCMYSMDVTIYYDPCYLRFSNQNFLDTFLNNKQHIVPNGENVTSPAAAFDAAVGVLLNAIVDYVVLNSSSRFGTGEVDFDKSNPNIYALAQCTPDMSPDVCRACLDQIVKVMPKHFSGRQGGRILGLRCNYRFELYPPFSGSSLVHLPADPGSTVTPPPTMGVIYIEGTKNKAITVLVIALVTISSALTFTLVCLCVWIRRKPRGSVQYSSNKENNESIDLFMLDFSKLQVATENFAQRNKLGEGGFGAVYKGSLPDGQQIAVKRLSQGSNQGMEELKNELVLVAKLQHRNLVRLIGVCLEEQEKLVVYEYMPNKSLDKILFDREKSKDLDWGKRFKIINGIVRGLQYVHEDSQLKIIHRDLKASNILLDLHLNPKISDFGLARPFVGEQSKDVTNRVVGTFGYMAPEYFIHGHYSIKSDVFSFGILVLEIITGRRNCSSYNTQQSFHFLTIIWEHWTKGTILEIVDPFLMGFPEGQVLTCVHVGLLCIQENPLDRPTMSAVNAILSTNTSSLQNPSKPAFCSRATNTDSELHQEVRSATCKPAVVSQNEVTITELQAR